MPGESKILPVTPATAGTAPEALPLVEIRVRKVGGGAWRRRLTWAEVILAFLFVECAVWAARLSVRSRWAVAAGAMVVFLAVLNRPSASRLGLSLPDARGTAIVVGLAATFCLLMVAATLLAGGQIPANPTFPNWNMAWKYVLWALVQEFLLQSFFFIRCEQLFGSERAVWVTGSLFAFTHLPNLVLTSCTLFSGLFFCEMFRRYRNIYGLGVAHAMLGLTLSSVVPEGLLQHMRVGIGYLQ